MQTTAKRSRFVREVTAGAAPSHADGPEPYSTRFRLNKYLPSNFLISFNSQLHPQDVKNRLTVIRHEMGLIDCPPASWHAANARYRPAVYQLTQKGRQMLAAHGRTRRTFATNEDFAHEFGTCLTAASFALWSAGAPRNQLL